MKKILFAVMALILGLIAALAIAEIGLRLSGMGAGLPDVIPDPVLHHVHQRDITFLSYSPTGEFYGGWQRYGIDGWREPLSGLTKTRATCRIAFMGDSFTEGLQVPYAKSFGGLLDSATRCGVRNFGLGSASPVLYSLVWDHAVAQWHPDLVILQLYSNDIREDQGFADIALRDTQGRIIAVPASARNPVVDLVRKSVVFRFLRRFQQAAGWRIANWDQPMTTAGGYVEEFPTITPLTSQTVLELNRKIEASGGKLVIFVVPSKSRLLSGQAQFPEPEFSDRWKAWTAQHNIAFVDLVPTFRASAAKGIAGFLPKDIHFDTAGNAVTAQTLCKAMPEYFDAARCADLGR